MSCDQLAFLTFHVSARATTWLDIAQCTNAYDHGRFFSRSTKQSVSVILFSTPRGSTPSVDCVPEMPPKLWLGHSHSNSSTPSRLTGEESTEDAIDSFIIVDVGAPFDFRIPSFPLLVITLRHIRFEVQGESEDEVIKYDGFIKDDPSLDE